MYEFRDRRIRHKDTKWQNLFYQITHQQIEKEW